MSRAAQGRPGQQIGPLKEKTVHAHITKQRIHAIVGQVIDELEDRRRKGKSDYVAKLANEVEEHGLAAWQALRDLLPRDDPATSSAGTTVQNFGSVFVAAVREASERRAEQAAMTGLPVIDVTAEPIVEDVKHEPAGQEHPDW
jgi:hypothetical protein